MKSYLLLWLAVPALAGCALLREPEPPAAPVVAPPPVAPAPAPPAPPPESEDVAALLAYNQRLLAASPDELRREYQAAQQAFSRDRGEMNRLRLALLLLVPGVPWRDDVRLQGLLEGAGGRVGAAESPRRQFLALLQRLVAERQRELKRADELQQKLDAMLRIERSLRGNPKK